MSDRDRVAAVLRLVRADIALSQPQRVERLLSHGDPDQVVAENGGDVPSLTREVEDLMAAWDWGSFSVTTLLDIDYPETLRGIREAPALIFSTGQTKASEMGVSIVGSRKASAGALRAAGELAYRIAQCDIPVISGLATGIDAAAHEATLDAGGRTVAFMGTGIAKTYPAKHRDLRERIEASGGAIYSQFLPNDHGSRATFPMRNAVMSGYGAATVVIAADEKSGTRHQVASAVKHGRAVILSGKVASETTWGKKLVNERKALPARSTEDALNLVINEVRDAQVGLSLFA